MRMLGKSMSNNRSNDFISFAKTGKTEKLQKAICTGIDILTQDGKAFILSSRFGQVKSLDILLNNLQSVQKQNVLRHCFLEGCSSNQREVVDYLLDNYFSDLNAEGMEEMALKSCIIGNHTDMLLYLCAKYNFNINLNNDIVEWALRNDYQDSYAKLEVVLLNKLLKEKTQNLSHKKETIKI